MMTEDVQWIISIAITVIALVGGIIARDRYIFRSIYGRNEKARDNMDNLKAEFITRSEVASQLELLGKQIDSNAQRVENINSQIDAKINGITTRIDELIKAIVDGKK